MRSTRPRRLAAIATTVAVLGATFALVGLADATSVSALKPVNLPGATLSAAADVNDAGVIAGWSDSTGNSIHGFTYDPATDTYKDLGAPPGLFTSAAAVNNHGVVAGDVEDEAGIWEPSTGAWKTLGFLGTGTDSSANDINDAGYVVGQSENSDGWLMPYFWDPTTETMKFIGDFGGNYGSANGINNNGIMVGETTDAGGHSRAFMYDIATGEMKDIGDLGGDDAWANDINDHGIIVGNSATSTTTRSHAFRYDMATGQMVDIGKLHPTHDLIQGMGVSNDGYIVGTSGIFLTPVDEGFIWDPATGQMTGFGQLAPDTASNAYNIGTQGIVVGATFPTEQGVWAQVTDLPGAPDSLAATGCGGQIDLSWTEGFDGYTDVTGYTLTRDGQQLAHLGADARSYTDGNLSIGTTYDYELTATNAEGTGPAATVSASASACPTTTTTSTTSAPAPQALTPTFTG